MTVRNKTTSIGVLGFIVLATISDVVTTFSSYQVVVAIRGIAGLVVVYSILFSLAVKGVQFRALATSVGCFLFGSYAIVLSYYNGSIGIGWQSFAVDFVVVLSGVFLVGCHPQNEEGIIQTKGRRWLLCYFLGGLALTTAAGGLEFGFLPRYIFEVGSEEIGREETYSLGISFFFGLATIVAISYLVDAKNGIQLFLGVLLSTMFFFLCILGGGRGEVVIALIVAGMLLAYKKTLLLLIVVMVIALPLALVVDWATIIDQLAFFQRIAELGGGGLSYRDVLLVKAFDLLINEPKCLLMGCGQAYFQYYHNYDYGLYPHNIVVEAIVIFGLPIVLCAFVFAYLGIREYYLLVRKFDLFLLVFTYAFLVALKSGSFFGSWIVAISFINFISIGIGSLLVPIRNQLDKLDRCEKHL